jgi:dGTPase
LEVAQIGRSLARTLRLNEDLVEAIALAHDLGHTPFGHAGQEALNECIHEYGGFEHNLQSLRVVDQLEERYPGFNGLNLSFETREGVLKHCSYSNALRLEEQEPGGVGRRFINRTQPSLEAQLCNQADEIAYNAHDVDDGIRSGLLSMKQLESITIFGQLIPKVISDYPNLGGPKTNRRLLYEVIRRMLSEQIADVITTTQKELNRVNPQSVEAVRMAKPFIKFSSEMQKNSNELKSFLMQNLYRHKQVTQTMDKARKIIKELFLEYLKAPNEMQEAFALRANEVKDNAKENQFRVVADYIAGMTDRFATSEHERMIGEK